MWTRQKSCVSFVVKIGDKKLDFGHEIKHSSKILDNYGDLTTEITQRIRPGRSAFEKLKNIG